MRMLLLILMSDVSYVPTQEALVAHELQTISSTYIPPFASLHTHCSRRRFYRRKLTTTGLHEAPQDGHARSFSW
ncbi:hypothetical protein GGR54DRAFT_584198 [Hypoxylon sp. NC1633]|nr:hypothetical protein GGR54DRAFT_584198 [Hypoxylon sp. NC1633]